MLKEPIHECPSEVMVTQHIETRNARDIAGKLTEYWAPLWRRNPKCEDEDHWLEFDNLIQILPTHDILEIEISLMMFKSAIDKLKPFAAPGIDGISAFELQTLPDSLLQQLLDTLGHFEDGFPEWFMIARTFPLNKTDSIPLSSQTRPITVLSQIYRAWGAMICHQVLQKWNSILPSGITGLLPTRGSHFAAS